MSEHVDAVIRVSRTVETRWSSESWNAISRLQAEVERLGWEVEIVLAKSSQIVPPPEPESVGASRP